MIEVTGYVILSALVIPPILFCYFRYMDWLVEKIKGNS